MAAEIEHQTSLPDLPQDCLVHICGLHLESTDIINFAATCRKHKFALENDLLWRLRVEAEFGVHWRESYWIHDDSIPQLLVDQPEPNRGHFRKIYRHLTQYGIILRRKTPAAQASLNPIKLLAIGGDSTGKSSCMTRFTDDEFRDAYTPTIGVDFRKQPAETVEKFPIQLTVNLQLWDTAGAEKFRTIVQAYYRGAHAFLLFFSLTNRKSFEGIPGWLDTIKQSASPNAGTPPTVLLIGTKADLIDQREVSIEEARSFALERKIYYFETSAKTGAGVDRVYMAAASIVLRRIVSSPEFVTPTQSAAAPPAAPAPTGALTWLAGLVGRIFPGSGRSESSSGLK